MEIRNKIFIILFIGILLITMIVPKVNATVYDDLINSMDGVQTGDTTPGNKIVEGINTIFSLIRYVGTGLSLLVVMVLGIRYMTSSVEDKAEIKKKAVPIVIGCVLIFATTNIMAIVIDIVSKI